MKREVKFRGIRVDNNQLIYGNLFIPSKGVKGIYICPDTTYADFYPDFEDGDDLKKHKNKGIALGHFFEVNPDTVGQLTGLKDKNGREIWEGDILDFDERIWGGRFIPEVIRMEQIIGDWRYCGSIQDVSEWRKVIGNIYENPELLK